MDQIRCALSHDHQDKVDEDSTLKERFVSPSPEVFTKLKQELEVALLEHQGEVHLLHFFLISPPFLLSFFLPFVILSLFLQGICLDG